MRLPYAPAAHVTILDAMELDLDAATLAAWDAMERDTLPVDALRQELAATAAHQAKPWEPVVPTGLHFAGWHGITELAG